MISDYWEYFAALAFAYHDAPEGTDDVDVAWHELAAAIKHHRATGGPEPRDPDTYSSYWISAPPEGQP